jgi:hypothetical protein
VVLWAGRLPRRCRLSVRFGASARHQAIVLHEPPLRLYSRLPTCCSRATGFRFAATGFLFASACARLASACARLASACARPAAADAR